MSTKKDGETKTVLKNLLILMLIFYFTMYIICLISAAALGEFNEGGAFNGDMQLFNAGYLPFWHYQCGVGEGDVALAVWLGQVFAQLALLAGIFFIVRSTLHAWDYSVTVSFLHFCLTCIVTQAAPSTWQWWVTLVVTTLLVSLASELMCYFLIDLKEIQKT
mmetsp:Transcript_14723/g.29085  ORF Transcript_14723/g.29085 Transcript_14723/m.29085 type:complete len:162 (-) Transcript_14723:204-689(-)|eukprot:CAMPEP_0173415426 /NCGR_PEP_ID=MMETSP1356-20130122/84853_1 /TAXON_ID=77927 ORGANISM="Hemiselmis virescens, Strain PCC157" /NCGR_SAMPLE_ID=MMETSP1356 /ASSEMBLY_ACC=CAM_ASM_000847 /LENGTH=161 /DNA_ID=CAMNT_0014377669 /DNA_START=440 /DNA_END=925 /DNA_ORIENTATION=+